MSSQWDTVGGPRMSRVWNVPLTDFRNLFSFFTGVGLMSSCRYDTTSIYSEIMANILHSCSTSAQLVRLNSDGGDSGSNKWRRGYNDAYSGEWRSLRLADLPRLYSTHTISGEQNFLQTILTAGMALRLHVTEVFVQNTALEICLQVTNTSFVSSRKTFCTFIKDWKWNASDKYLPTRTLLWITCYYHIPYRIISSGTDSYFLFVCSVISCFFLAIHSLNK
jgi:hypothetical protein